jgi:hypothetical protein
MTEGVDSPSLSKEVRVEGGEEKTKWNSDTNIKYLTKCVRKEKSPPCHSDVSIGQETFLLLQTFLPPFILLNASSRSILLYESFTSFMKRER